MFLKMQDIDLLEGDVWGHRKDINEYYEINPAFFEKVLSLKSEGLSDNEIISRLERESRLCQENQGDREGFIIIIIIIKGDYLHRLAHAGVLYSFL